MQMYNLNLTEKNSKKTGEDVKAYFPGQLT